MNTQKIQELKWQNVKALLIEEHIKRNEKSQNKRNFQAKTKRYLPKRETYLAREEIKRITLERKTPRKDLYMISNAPSVKNLDILREIAR